MVIWFRFAIVKWLLEMFRKICDSSRFDNHLTIAQRAKRNHIENHLVFCKKTFYQTLF